MTSMRHLPTRRIVSVLTRAMRRAMEPPARIYCALTSSSVNPTWNPMRIVAARSAAVISALQSVDHVVPLKMAARCVSGVASCCRRCAKRRQMAATAHARGCPVAPCSIDSPLTPFFCVVKRRLTKVVAEQVAKKAVVDWKGWLPTKNCMLPRLKGVVTVLVQPAQYSPGQSRKKKAIQTRSVIAWSRGETLLVAESMQWRMETGRGRNLPGEGYSFT